jgi:amino acid permease
LYEYTYTYINNKTMKSTTTFILLLGNILLTSPSFILAFTLTSPSSSSSSSLSNINVNKVGAVRHLPTFGGSSSSSSSSSRSGRISNKTHNNSESTTALSSALASSESSDSNTNTSNNDGKQGIAASTFSLVKACVGSGVLALPAGVAAIGDVSAALVPASMVMFVLGGLSAYSFYMIGRISRLQGSETTKSIGAAWEDEVGANSSWIVSLSTFLTPLGAALTYSIILGDILSALAQSAGMTGILAKRQTSILGVTTAVLYPLCHLKSLAALAPISIIGVVGMMLTSLFMVARAIPGGPYCVASGGAFLSTLSPALQPSFGIIGNNAYSSSILILISMAATSFLVHFSAQDFYDGLKDTSMKRFGTLTGLGFGITVLMNILVMASGFCTFGGNCQGMILNNYSAKDIGATLCRMIVTISLIGSYPIFVRAVKSSFFELTMKGKEISESTNKKVTNLLLGGLTAAALVLKDAGVMVSLTGALLGSAIIYSFPSFIYLKLTKRLMLEGKLKKSFGVTVERFANKFLVGLGGILGVLGTAVTLGVL